MKRIVLLVAISVMALAKTFATDYYLSASGSDSNDGKSRSKAFATLGKAQSVVAAGDNVYILPDTFKVKSSEISLTESIYKIVYNFKQKGSEGKPIKFVGLTESGKRPVFDMSAVNPKGYRITAFYVTGQYLVFRNFEVIGMMVNLTEHTQSENFRVKNGSHNTFDNIAVHDGMGVGFYFTGNCSHNLVLNCDGYNNYDSVSEDGKGGQNDAFGCHVTAGYENNIFIGCRAWNNADDGYDLIHCFSPVTFCYSIAYHNGYDADGNKRQDGNGFKAGGYGMSDSDISLPSSGCPRHKVYHCLSLSNKSSGFYANHHLGGIDFSNNTAVSNGGYNYNMLNRKGASASNNTDVDGYGHKLENNLSVGSKHVTNLDTSSGKNTITGNSFTWKNSAWTNSYTATFESENLSRLTRARKSDGMLSTTTTLTVYNQTEYTGMGCDFSGYEEAIVAAKRISGAELVEDETETTETTVTGVSTDVKANAVTKTTTWDFSDLTAGTIGQYVDYNDLVIRATSGSHAITVNSDGSASFAANGSNIASYLSNDKTAADDLDNATYDRCLAFNAGVAGTTTVTFTANKEGEDRYFQIFFKAAGKDAVVEEVAVSKEQTTVSLTSTEAGTFFIASTIGSNVFDVKFVPTISAGLSTDVKANAVTKTTTWDFSDLTAGSVEQYVDYNDLVLRATSGSHAITVNSDGSLGFAANGANVVSYLSNDKTAADDLDNATYDRCLAFNAGVAGTTTVTFTANKEGEDRYFQIFFKAAGKDAVVEEVAVSKEQTTVSLTSTEAGTFFIASTIGSNVFDVKFVPTISAGLTTDVKAEEVIRKTTWDFSKLSECTIEQYVEYKDLVLRATAGSHAITVNSDGTVSFANNGATIASYLNNEKTAADNLNNTAYDRCLAFNAGVAGTTTVTFSASKVGDDRYFQIYFKAPGKDAVVKEVAVSKDQTTVSLTSTEEGSFFIASTIACNVHNVQFVPTSVVSTDITGKPVSRRRVWDFTALSAGSIEQYTEYDDMVMRATSGSHAITVNEDGSISFAANGANIGSYLNNEKTAADNLENTTYDRCLAFNTAVAGTTTVTFSSNKEEDGRYFQIYFKAAGKDAVVEEVAVAKAQTTVTLTADEAGSFFIASTIGSTIYEVEFVPTATGIFSVLNDANNFQKQNTKAYTITGLPVGNGYRGIVIRNGKKYLMK